MKAADLLCYKRRRRRVRMSRAKRTPSRRGIMQPVMEGTPPDMLTGTTDLRVLLPGGHTVKMCVGRSTPMMDLLVQVTTLNKISPGAHVLQAIGERGILPYKPSTPVGALDVWTIQVVPKSKQGATSLKKAPLKPINHQQPFEQTFRLQVHLPRNQLYVTRVSPRTRLSDILAQTCGEKNLDPGKYELRHPVDLSQPLSPACTLADYSLQEVTVVPRSSLSTSDIMALQRESMCDGSISSDSLGGRSISPARSDESASRSASPPAPMAPPTRPARKRRPAPKPPGQSTGEAVSHSRNSSDSSGYHEASGLSDKETAQPKSLSRSMSSLTGHYSTSTTSLSSSTGLKKKKAAPPPPPPHLNKTTSLERHLSGKSMHQPPDRCSTLPGKMRICESTDSIHQAEPTESFQQIDVKTSSPTESFQQIEVKTSSPTESFQQIDVKMSSPTESFQQIDVKTSSPTESFQQTSESSVPSPTDTSDVKMAGSSPPVEPPVEFARTPTDVDDAEAFRDVTGELDILPPPPMPEDDLSVDWEYQLPAPPSAFRDTDSPPLTDRATIGLTDVEESESVLRRNPLFIPQEYDNEHETNLKLVSDISHSRDNVKDSRNLDDTKRSQDSFPASCNNTVTETNNADYQQKTKNIHTVQQTMDSSKFVHKELHGAAEKNSIVYNDCKQTKSNETVQQTTEEAVDEAAESHSIVHNDCKQTKSNETVQQTTEDSKAVDEAAESHSIVHNDCKQTKSNETVQQRTEESSVHREAGRAAKIVDTVPKLFSELQQTCRSQARRPSGEVNFVRPPDGVGRLNNFTITTYQRSSASTEPPKLYMHQKFGSTSELNSASSQEVGGAGVKRSTSYISLNNPTSISHTDRTKSVGNLAAEGEQASRRDIPLQSLQVLRSILNQQQTSAAPKSLEEPKRYVYRGPPAVNFTTWSERPKSQVSIKMDGDYRVGVGQAFDVTDTKEPSRVPVVRAVELKKSFKSNTLLNGSDLKKPDRTARRYTSVVGINTEPDRSASFREQRGPSVVRVNGYSAPRQLMPVVKGFQFAAPAANRDKSPVRSTLQRSESTSVVRSWKTEPLAPPPPPMVKKTTPRPRPVSMPNPRDQLMDAIRNFGGRGNLRHVCSSRDNVVLIRQVAQT